MLTRAERIIAKALTTGNDVVEPTEEAYSRRVVPNDGRVGTLRGIKGPLLRVQWDGRTEIHCYHESYVKLARNQA